MGCSHYSYTDSERHCRCHMGCCKAPGPRKAAGAWSPAGSPIRNRQVVAAPAGVLAILQVLGDMPVVGRTAAVRTEVVVASLQELGVERELVVEVGDTRGKQAAVVVGIPGTECRVGYRKIHSQRKHFVADIEAAAEENRRKNYFEAEIHQTQRFG